MVVPFLSGPGRKALAERRDSVLPSRATSAPAARGPRLTGHRARGGPCIRRVRHRVVRAERRDAPALLRAELVRDLAHGPDLAHGLADQAHRVYCPVRARRREHRGPRVRVSAAAASATKRAMKAR